jgi:hypothetical protein
VALRRKFENRVAESGPLWNLETGDPKLDCEDIQLAIDDSDLDAITKGLSEAVEQAIPVIVDQTSTALLKRAKREARERFAARDIQRSAFERNLLNRWRKPLTLFALEIELAVEMGGLANRWLRRRKRLKKAPIVEVITRLHARACQVAGEVEALLRCGFADGAITRWRTLHELVVVSWLLVEHEADLSERYLLHLDIDSLRAARQFQMFAPLLGYQVIPKKQTDAIERRAKQLVKRFGKTFVNEYGWAADAIGIPNPRFTDIEKAVDLSRLRPYYKLASGNVHAGPKGAFFRIGMLASSQRILLAGPSNAGLDEAGQLAAHSLAQITVALLRIETTLDAVIWSKLLIQLSGDVGASFVSVQRGLVREDRARQKQDKSVSKEKRRRPSAG